MFKLIVLSVYFLFAIVSGSVQYCSEGNYDLCLGFSGNASVATPLQLKRRYKRILKEDVITWETSCDDQDGLCLPLVNNTLFVDKLRGTRRVGLSRTSAGVNYINGKLELTNSSNCLTIVECASGGGEFCNPYSTKSISRPGQIVEGAYIVLKPCMQNASVAQDFLLDPDCRKGCTRELLMNLECDQECNYAECFWDLAQCNSTYSPTPRRFKTSKPTSRPTLMPTSNPTSQPSILPSFTPSVLPTKLPSTHPTLPPSILVTNRSPSLSPSSSLTANPTMVPSLKPSLKPSVSPTNNPIKTPMPNIITTSAPTVRPSGPVKPEGITGSPTATASLTSGGFVALWVILVLLFLLGLSGVIYYFYKKGKDAVSHPQTRLPTDPPALPSGF